ncbi:hypothetical protein I3843_07G087900 [Carya illinoinensis]|uniref:FLZ-type domain-containing protein n=1 Tax=Carya illinoinensis TaxID=32201 RepID=A0A8T1Q3Z3_CARIL|nr:FCS-Like Zinc finger 16 [Carya illinoinensis]KAG2697060.1 hypothetical protein I3760_07G088400 [Carya illinoinensis]KAG6647600.1 hypothetical protein CIPAW_07G089300 [Carya illinoinensis]KAG6703591.1 hypothetical protein I3842_07G091600 [Carya illinoinensis]KAG7970518.1 hypothetical protein I3843_07G087900 [Carya illinoinensis]
MAAKRSRIARSSSFGDTSVLNQVLPPPNTASPELHYDVRKAPSTARPPPSVSAESDHPPPGILTLASPDVEQDSLVWQVGNFFEKCYRCKRSISEDEEVFMYSYLRAFCSSECRAKQITMDKLGEEVLGNQ